MIVRVADGAIVITVSDDGIGIEAHGGTLVAASAGSGHGSQFTVTLPLAME